MYDNISLFSTVVFIGTLFYVIVSKRNTKKHFTENMTKFNARIETSKIEMNELNNEISEKAVMFQTMIGDGEFTKLKMEEMLMGGENTGDIRNGDMSDVYSVFDLPKHYSDKKILQHNG